MLKQTLVVSMVALFAAAPAFAQDGGQNADQVAKAKADIEKYASPATTWDGPTTGPKIETGKTIVVLAGDLKNGGILGVTNGVEEAAKAASWTVKVLDGAGSVQGRAAAFGQALALKPDGIVINGFDAVEQQAALDEACNAKIPMVSWHVGTGIGADAQACIFANVTTDPMEVSKVAAEWAYLDADQKPGVVIFTDSTYKIAVAKADEMKKTIEDLGGTVLEYVDTPIADTSNRMPTLTTALLQRYGDAWTHSLAINDIYFDFMGPSLASAGIAGDANPKSVAAGDGSESAYQRIRSAQYQAVTVAEPLNLQGWQLIDEMNRAMQGQEWSGYVTPLHVVTAENIDSDGGSENRFDPENGYRQEYEKIWGVEQAQ